MPLSKGGGTINYSAPATANQLGARPLSIGRAAAFQVTDLPDFIRIRSGLEFGCARTALRSSESVSQSASDQLLSALIRQRHILPSPAVYAGDGLPLAVSLPRLPQPRPC